MKTRHEFVDRFEAAWKQPNPRFVELFHAEGTLFQSGMERPIRRDQISAQVEAIQSLLTGQRVVVDRWAAQGDDVFIEWTSMATFRGEGVSWSGASRFTLRDGLIIEEIAYFDTLPLRALVDPALRRGDMTAAAVAANGSTGD